MQLTAETIYGFSNTVLHKNFDNPVPTPKFHLEMWELVTSARKYVAIAAPRGHAKSSAITHTFVLACILFKERDYVLIVSDTEGQAIQFLGDIKRELLENEDIAQLFGFKGLIKDTEANIVGEFEDGRQFRITAKGSEQKLRGLKWRNKRPNLVVCDDLESDEIVLNEERRTKFKRWFYNALLPCGSRDCLFRVVGTILHLDSLLEAFMPQIGHENTQVHDLKMTLKNPSKQQWLSVRYKAHNDDFSKLLWPEMFSKERLEEIRMGYVEQGFPEGYAQEYLNYPIDESTSYFRKSDFKDLGNHMEPMDFYVGVDLAISERDGRAYTAMVVAGLGPSGKLRVMDVRRFRGDSLDIIEELFAINDMYSPYMFIIEQENIARSIGPMLEAEMLRRKKFLNIEKAQVTADKIKRARSIQARMRSGGVEFNKEASWFPQFQQELLQFPRGKYADQVDAFAHIGLALDKMVDPRTAQEIIDEQYEEEVQTLYEFDAGRNYMTGY